MKNILKALGLCMVLLCTSAQADWKKTFLKMPGAVINTGLEGIKENKLWAAGAVFAGLTIKYHAQIIYGIAGSLSRDTGSQQVQDQSGTPSKPSAFAKFKENYLTTKNLKRAVRGGAYAFLGAFAYKIWGKK